MPTATATPAPKAKVSEKIIRTETRDPVEVPIVPPTPAPTPSGDFWGFIETLTPDDWKHKKISVTLYRYPLGQTKPDKLGRYVKTYKADAPLLSEDQIFEEFGGGQFDAMLKGPSPSDPTKTSLLSRHSWEMDGPAKNPWAAPAAAPGVPAGSDLAQTLAVLLPQLQTLLAKAAPHGAELTSTLDTIAKLNAALPQKEGIRELTGALTDLQKLGGAKTDGGGTIREVLGILKEFGIIGAATEKKSLAAEIKEVLEIATLVNRGGGGGDEGGGGRRRDWPTALVENLPGILKEVSPIADKFADAAKSNARVAELRAGTPARRLPPASSTPSANAGAPAAAAPVPAEESPASRTVRAPETEPAQDARPESSAFVPPSLEWVKGRTVQMFGEGKSGDMIAEWLDLLDARLGAWLGSMDEAAFRSFVESDAILKAIVSAPRYPAFVRDFVGYFSEEENENQGGSAPADKANEK